MKKFYTLCMGLIAALAMQAQSDFPLQFADKNGNIIADGTTLDITEYEADGFGDVQLPSGLYVKNTTNEAVQAGGEYNIQTMSNGAFQTCFPVNCASQSNTGTYATTDGSIAAGELKDMKTEWLPTAEGSCKVAYQLVVYKQNPITKKWVKDDSKTGPTVMLNFTYSTSGIGSAAAGKQVRQVEYYSLTGRKVQKPVKGVYLVKTTYADGTKKSQKHLFI